MLTLYAANTPTKATVADIAFNTDGLTALISAKNPSQIVARLVNTYKLNRTLGGKLYGIIRLSHPTKHNGQV